jgi:hypothetical protein
METVGLGLYFEDLPIGRRFKTIDRTVTEADITNFVNCTGMVEVLFTRTRGSTCCSARNEEYPRGEFRGIPVSRLTPLMLRCAASKTSGLSITG